MTILLIVMLVGQDEFENKKILMNDDESRLIHLVLGMGLRRRC